MNYYGYHRTSTTEQHLDRGIKEITDFCLRQNYPLKKIYTDQWTGRSFQRPRYTVLTEDILRPGDVLIITEIDRLGRNKKGIVDELKKLRENGIRIMILELPTTLQDFTGMGNELASMMIDMINNILIEIYAAAAEAEYFKREKRQKEGYQRLRNNHEWDRLGRPTVMKQKEFNRQYERVLRGEIRPFELMRQMGMKKATFYKYRKVYMAADQSEDRKTIF